MNHPIGDHGKKIAQMGAVFLILVLAGLGTALIRFWGLTLFFDGTALLTFAIGLTEIFSKN
jgi:cyanate permease